jgi:hypothetical protein
MACDFYLNRLQKRIFCGESSYLKRKIYRQPIGLRFAKELDIIFEWRHSVRHPNLKDKIREAT